MALASAPDAQLKCDRQAAVKALVAAERDAMTGGVRPDAGARLLALLLDDAATLEALTSAVRAAMSVDDERRLLLTVAAGAQRHGGRVAALERVIAAEVDATSALGSLFRSNNARTKLVNAHMRAVSSRYVADTLRPALAAVKELPAALEVDPARASDAECYSNGEALADTASSIFDAVLRSSSAAPIEMRRVVAALLRLTHAKFGEESRRVAFGGYLFLRLLCPALSAPSHGGADSLLEEPPTPAVSRTLLLVSKIIQTAASGTTFKKEAYMQRFNPLVDRLSAKLDAFIDAFVTLPPGAETEPPTPRIQAVFGDENTATRKVSMMQSLGKHKLVGVRA